MLKFAVEDHELRETQSWVLSENYHEIEKWETTLVDAHLRVADMFISQKPLILFGQDSNKPKKDTGMIADGIYFVNPTGIRKPSDCILVNTLFLDECVGNLSDGTKENKTIFEQIIDFGYILEEETITEFLVHANKNNGMHCIYVHKKAAEELAKD